MTTSRIASTSGSTIPVVSFKATIMRTTSKATSWPSLRTRVCLLNNLFLFCVINMCTILRSSIDYYCFSLYYIFSQLSGRPYTLTCTCVCGFTNTFNPLSHFQEHCGVCLRGKISLSISWECLENWTLGKTIETYTVEFRPTNLIHSRCGFNPFQVWISQLEILYVVREFQAKHSLHSRI